MADRREKWTENKKAHLLVTSMANLKGIWTVIQMENLRASLLVLQTVILLEWEMESQWARRSEEELVIGLELEKVYERSLR